MTWRFRKSVKLFPGVRLNLTNRGISTTVGVRGLASVNIGTRGTHLNLGVPGTGLSSRTKFGGSMPGTRQPVNPSNQIPELQSGFPSLEETGVIKSAAAEELTSEGLVSLKETLREAFQEYADISRERATAWAELQPARHRREKLEKSFIARTFRKGAIADATLKAEESQAKFDELGEQLKLCVVKLENNFDVEFARQYEELLRTFTEITQCSVIWDNTAAVGVSLAERSAASQSIERVPVAFGLRHIPIIESPTPAMHMANANGGDIYLYPGFALMAGQNDFALIDYKDVQVGAKSLNFLESERIPPDARVTGSTWAKVNKDGTRDRRFANNYEISIVEYGGLTLISDKGLNESYMFSNADKTAAFTRALLNYKSLLASLPSR